MKRMSIRIRRFSSPLAGVFCVLAVASTAHAPRESRAQSLQDDPFAVPVGLESAVEFWKNVYGVWSQDEVTFHDRDDLDIIYRRMDQKKSDTPSGYAANEAAQQAIVDHYRRILLELATRNPDPRTLSGEYAEVHALFGARGNPDRWRYAADRIRVQRGLREKFQRGLIHAGQ